LAYHTLLVLWNGIALLLAAWGLLGQRGIPDRRLAGLHAGAAGASWFTLSGPIITALAAVISLRALVQDPLAPWWGVAGLVATAAPCVALACQSARRRAIYAGGVLLNVAASAAWLDLAGAGANLLDLIYVNILAATLPCALWLVLERTVFQPAERDSMRKPGVGLHRVAAVVSLAMGLLVIGVGLALDAQGITSTWSAELAWLSYFSLAQAVVLTLWDPRARLVLLALYATGLLGVGRLLHSFQLQGEPLHWTGTIFAAAYALATSFVANRRRTIAAALRRGRIPVTPRDCRRAWRWITSVNTAVAIFVAAMAYWAALAAAIPFSWAWVAPSMEAAWLHRLVAMFVAMIAVSILYSVGIVKLIRRENEWTRAAQHLVAVSLALAAVALCGLVAAELYFYFNEGGVPIHPVALALTAATFVGVALAALAAAVVPGRDPLNLNERQRTAYVYAAEIFVALLFLHFRLTMPWLFRGVFAQYWPLMVMLIAFLGVGLAEYFQRRRQHVLSTPLRHTGVLLPVLPLIGFWVGPPTNVDYSGLLLSVGALYGVLAAVRRSFAFTIAAIVALNLSLWWLLYRVDGLGLTHHPQLWIIPPALCVLVAAHLNARQLGADRVATIRYLTATFIYASSTADIFLNGVAQAPWLPVVLAGFALIGIMAGIWLGIRAFVYLGTAFLLVAISTVIWYGAVDLEQTWVWWVSGIVTGILIITLFAYFERRDRE